MDVVRKIRGGAEGGGEEPLPVLDIDLDEWLTEIEIENNGAYRKDKKGRSWWLPAPELAFYERANNDPAMADDEDFWRWFDGFRDERRLKQHRAAVWDYGSGVKKTYDSGSYFKSMWTGFGFGKGSYGSAETTELATALGFVQTLIQAVRTREGRYDVEFAAGDSPEAPVSYSDLTGGNRIVISPQAALDKKINADRRIRVTTGFALHEASHTEHTIDRWPVLIKPFPLKPPQVASLLMNVIEDVRIEQIMGNDFPGFADYFEDMRQYLWEIGDAKKRETMGDMPVDLMTALSFIVRTIRWPDKLEPALSSDEAKEEFAWWSEWHEGYKPLKSNADIRVHLEKALNRLAAMFREDMEKATKAYEDAEKEARGREEAIRELIKRLADDLKKSMDAKDGCSRESMDKLSSADAREVVRKLEEEWEIEKKGDHTPDDEAGTVRNFDMLIRKPALPSSARYSPDRDPMSRRLRSAFVLRPARPEYSDRLLFQGQVDDDELWRWKVNDYRVFEQKIRETAPDTDITLLVDESGSMAGGSRIATAKRLAELMLDCLSGMDGVNLRVRGHTGQNGDFSEGIVINRIWEPGDDPARITLINADSQNLDGYAIEWCVKELMQGRGATQKVLIVISDGEPYGHGYYGHPAALHVRSVVNKAERNGVYVIQLGVGQDLSESSMRSMFNHYIPYTNDENLLRDLTKLMSKLF
jgi:hypothetical protein